MTTKIHPNWRTVQPGVEWWICNYGRFGIHKLLGKWKIYIADAAGYQDWEFFDLDEEEAQFILALSCPEVLELLTSKFSREVQEAL